MADSMSLRGPDGWATWRDDGGLLGFAHRRLAILDPTSRSDQPMVSPDARYVIVFNGEIYNFMHLREMLISRGHTFRTTGVGAGHWRFTVWRRGRNATIHDGEAKSQSKSAHP